MLPFFLYVAILGHVRIPSLAYPDAPLAIRGPRQGAARDDLSRNAHRNFVEYIEKDGLAGAGLVAEIKEKGGGCDRGSSRRTPAERTTDRQRKGRTDDAYRGRGRRKP